MNHDNITILVYLQDFVGNCSVHLVVVSPSLARCDTVRGLILLVVKEGVDLVFAIASPPGLIFEICSLVIIGLLVCKPDRNDLATVIIL